MVSAHQRSEFNRHNCTISMYDHSWGSVSLLGWFTILCFFILLASPGLDEYAIAKKQEKKETNRENETNKERIAWTVNPELGMHHIFFTCHASPCHAVLLTRQELPRCFSSTFFHASSRNVSSFFKCVNKKLCVKNIEIFKLNDITDADAPSTPAGGHLSSSSLRLTSTLFPGDLLH